MYIILVLAMIAGVISGVVKLANAQPIERTTNLLDYMFDTRYKL